MKVYLSNAQVPELKPLTPDLRRLVFMRALAAMRRRSRLLYWMPVILCICGSIAGGWLLPALLYPIYPHVWDGFVLSTRVLVGFACIFVGAFLAGFIGQQLQRTKLRPYIRGIMEGDVREITGRLNKQS